MISLNQHCLLCLLIVKSPPPPTVTINCSSKQSNNANCPSGVSLCHTAALQCVVSTFKKEALPGIKPGFQARVHHYTKESLVVPGPTSLRSYLLKHQYICTHNLHLELNNIYSLMKKKLFNFQVDAVLTDGACSNRALVKQFFKGHPREELYTISDALVPGHSRVFISDPSVSKSKLDLDNH